MTQGTCPSCGAPVQFTAQTTRVVVCAQCRTVVARAGSALEAHEKLPPLVETGSELKHRQGRRRTPWGDESFRIVGRLQRDFGAGPRDEWYLEFSNGEPAWLMDLKHVWVLRSPAKDTPVFHGGYALRARVSVGVDGFTLQKEGTVRTLTGEGELPGDVHPGQVCRFMDGTDWYGDHLLSIEFISEGAPLQVLCGHDIALSTLGLSPEADAIDERYRAALAAKYQSITASVDEIRAAVLSECGVEDRAASDNRYSSDRGRALGGKFASRGISGALEAIRSVAVDQPAAAYAAALEEALDRAHFDSYDADDEDHAGPGAVNGVLLALKRVTRVG